MSGQLDLAPAAAVGAACWKDHTGANATQTKHQWSFLGTTLTEPRHSKDDFKTAFRRETAEYEVKFECMGRHKYTILDEVARIEGNGTICTYSPK